MVFAIKACQKGLATKAAERVWEAMIRPLLEYGSEIWHIGKEQEMERLQLQYGKALLGVGKSCASEVVRGELGWWRLASRADFIRLKFWARVSRMPNNRLTKQVLVQRMKESSDKPGSWCYRTRQSLLSVNLQQMWHNPMLPPNWERELKARLQDRERAIGSNVFKGKLS
jgi:hypothetical protein